MQSLDPEATLLFKVQGGKEIRIGPPGAPDFRFGGQNGSGFLILVTCPTSVQSLGPEATLVFELQESKETS